MGRQIYTPEQVAEIARRYDGKSGTIEQLLKEFGGRRHNIHKAAQRGGFKPRQRTEWTPEKDAYLREHWGKVPPAEIYAHLGVPEGTTAVFNRLKRIGHSTRHNEDLTIYDIEHLTKIDHRIWRRFIDDGWLRSYDEYGRDGKVWSRRVKIEWIVKFLRDHPEAFDYRNADKYVRAVLELDKLPDPPKFMLVTCRSDNWQDGVRVTPIGGCRVHHGEVALAEREHVFSHESCAAIGGTDLWAPLYETPNCPRCGCKVSRFSEKAVFTDDEPGDSDTLNAIASKLQLAYRDGRFFAADGSQVSEDELLRYVFSTKRNPGRAFQVFRRLIEAGMKVAPPNPVDRVSPNCLRYTLRDSQQKAFDAFLASGNVGVYWPPGQGKMYFLGMVFARLAGEHALFVHTRTIREQWIEFFKAHGDVRISQQWRPYHARVEILDADGQFRSRVRIFSYQTHESFDGWEFGVVGFDEAQFLPGNKASRLAMLKCDYRVGLSATPFREDGRADLIQMMTGLAIGEDWQEFRDAGQIPEVPIHVVIVQDLEQKHRALERCLARRRRTIVFSDAIDDGHRISAEQGIPFIHAATTRRLEVLADNRQVVMSRVGDCGIDTQDLEEVIEFNFHHGSRAQSLQRLGRLLHSRNPLRHTVLMTVKEFSLYHKRLQAMESKGFELRIEIYKDQARRGRPPAPQPVSAWAIQLGIKPPPRVASPIETQADKRARVMRRIEERRAAV